MMSVPEPTAGPGRLPAKSFTDLLVWRKAHQLALGVYKLTGVFPRQEVYGLTSQLRRATVSIPANIAEGFRRRGVADKLRMLNIAQGSLEEARYYLILGADLGYCEAGALQDEFESVSRLLQAYTRAIQGSRADAPAGKPSTSRR